MIQTNVRMPPDTQPPPPTDHEATRARLLDAAGEVFAQHGFEPATVRDICTRAGANIAAVNYHFRDKMGLYLAVIQESVCAARLAEMRKVAEQSQSPEHALYLIVFDKLQRMARATERGDWHIRLMAHEISNPTPGLDRVVELAIGPNYAMLRGILSQLLGLPPDHDTTRFCAHSIIGQVVYWATRGPLSPVSGPSSK